ncbi:MAG: hypothetical protein F7B06_13005 [Opitutae bacterium]|nr:hypothetical protein [Opitutae bacterium]
MEICYNKTQSSGGGYLSNPQLKECLTKSKTKNSGNFHDIPGFWANTHQKGDFFVKIPDFARMSQPLGLLCQNPFLKGRVGG